MSDDSSIKVSGLVDVTACILSLNRPGYLRDAIDSVLSQTQMPKEVVIFDNGSKSYVLAAVQEYLEKGVRWQGVDFTRSFIWNFRRAVVQAKSKYVFMMHDDDRLCPDFLEIQIHYLEKNPDVVAVSCNGYLIDDNGNRNGRLIMSNFEDSQVERYECSGDVAFKYAIDSCIPFSPIIYRTEALKLVDLRDEYGKVCDAVFICDLADIGIVALQSSALYECRMHSEQDSSYFSPEILAKLENFFWTRQTNSLADTFKLQSMLIRQHTSRNIHSFFRCLTKLRSIRHFFCELFKIWDGVFSNYMGLKIIVNAVKKRLVALWKK